MKFAASSCLGFSIVLSFVNGSYSLAAGHSDETDNHLIDVSNQESYEDSYGEVSYQDSYEDSYEDVSYQDYGHNREKKKYSRQTWIWH